MNKLLKNRKNTDVAIEILYAIAIENGFKMKVNWYNITDESKPPKFIEKDFIFIKNHDIKAWEDYQHGKAKETKEAA